mmetsp:Transcript_46627/g.116633  ORF Transcript_46627/g.116633 Transcript_46627/m.116633 type:complete len:203 (+) Transcript_46627:122-730(+)
MLNPRELQFGWWQQVSGQPRHFPRDSVRGQAAGLLDGGSADGRLQHRRVHNSSFAVEDGACGHTVSDAICGRVGAAHRAMAESRRICPALDHAGHRDLQHIRARLPDDPLPVCAALRVAAPARASAGSGGDQQGQGRSRILAANGHVAEHGPGQGVAGNGILVYCWIGHWSAPILRASSTKQRHDILIHKHCYNLPAGGTRA